MATRSSRWFVAALGVAVLTITTAFADRPPRRPDGRLGGATAHSAALTGVDDCGQLRAYATEVMVETVVSVRYGGYRWLPWLDAGGGQESGSAPSDFTSTNTQEAGVDELDIVKTDGSHLYVAQDDRLTVVRSWPPTESALTANLELPGWTSGLFLRGDRALVASNAWGGVGEPRFWSATRLDVVDVSDPSAPRSLRWLEVEGQLVGARMVDGHVYAVVRSYIPTPDPVWELVWRDDLGLPEVDWDATPEEREAAAALARDILRPLVAALVDRLELKDLVPLARDRSPLDPEAQAYPLLACDDLYLPARASQYSVLSVIHLDLDQGETAPVSAAGILADGWTVYASSRSLYVAQSGWWWWWGWGQMDNTSVIHKFELGGEDGVPVRYAATGDVPGWILNQFSMGEHDGYLRVATTPLDWWQGSPGGEPDGSTLTVLADNRLGELTPVGQVAGIAPGEQIYAARFLGDIGFLVTFERVDPLFTFDLSDPRNPRLVGELETPGYSAYLHPVGDGNLLAVGMDADDEGRVLGLSVSLFDVSDLANPRLADRYTVESSPDAWSWSEALWDHHAFTFHRGVLSIPAYLAEPGQPAFSGLLVMAVDPDQGIDELGRVDHADLAGPDQWPQMRRSVYVEDVIYSLSSHGIKVNDLFHPSVELARVPFLAP